jgi:arylsulfatase A-like enzyme
MLDNTVIIYTSDNGFFMGEHGLAGKWLMYEESIRLPLIIYDPRLPASRKGQRIDSMVLNIDMASTLCELGQAGTSPHAQGHSLVPLLRGEEFEERTVWFYEHLLDHPGIPHIEGVRSQQFKYICYPNQTPLCEEFFDLEKDPGEMNNLIGSEEQRDRIDLMRKQCQELRQQIRNE